MGEPPAETRRKRPALGAQAEVRAREGQVTVAVARPRCRQRQHQHREMVFRPHMWARIRIRKNVMAAFYKRKNAILCKWLKLGRPKNLYLTIAGIMLLL
jgi:hypothetical protein